MLEESRWFLNGNTDVKYLHDKNIHFWDGNLTEEYINT